MIPVKSMLYNLDMKLNKVATLEHQIIPLENKIVALNEAQIKIVKLKLDPNNPLGLGLDAFKKRYEDLEVLIEDAFDHPLPVQEVDPNINEWQADLTQLYKGGEPLPEGQTQGDYMFYIDSYVLATKGTCVDKVLYVNRGLTKHSDVLTLLANNNYIPSFEYAETFSTISGYQLGLYTDGTFTLVTAYVSYIRYPQKIDYAGYIDLDGNPSITQDSEFPHYMEDELLNYAVLELAMDTENVAAVQSTGERIKLSE